MISNNGKLSKFLCKFRIPFRMAFILVGLASTAWFLFRVIPKPSRAAYPCMRAAAPFMSAFVLYLLGISASIVSFKYARDNIRNTKYLPAGVLLICGIIAGTLVVIKPEKKASARSIAAEVIHPSNEPVGEGKGIYPGRVVWAWDPFATNEYCNGNTNGDGIYDENDNAYFLPANNDQGRIDIMLSDGLKQLSGQSTDSLAWDAIFRHFNRVEKKKSDLGYTDGEIIHIKINSGSTWGSPSDVSKNQFWGMYSFDLEKIEASWAGRPDIAETNPHVVLALVRQLVNFYGIPQDKIYVGDPMKNIYKHCYELWHNEFPGINYLGNDQISDYAGLDLQRLGRTPVELSSEDVIFYSDKGAVMTGAIRDKVYTVTQDADYMINVPALKAHALAGITLSAKNHFGTHTRNTAEHLHGGLVPSDGGTGDRNEYGHYRVQVDLMAHEKIGGNTMLVLVDGLYAGPEATSPPDKWQSSPFNGDWTSSLFLSQDQVALESVCFDFLRTEYVNKQCEDLSGDIVNVNYPNKSQAVDDYLHQAADPSNWPEDVIYDPENDGIAVVGLGAHEHWNSEDRKQYSRNLGQDSGIELFAPGLVNNLPESNSLIKGKHYLHTNSNATLFSGKLSSIYQDPDGDELSYAVVASDPGQVAITMLGDSSVTIQSLNGFTGMSEVGILVSDGTDTLVESASIYVREESSMSAKQGSDSLEFDGYGTDEIWENSDWYYIDQVWIPYRAELPSNDFSGRYKVSWSEEENLIYFLAETNDDVFVDGYIYNSDPGTGGGYPNYDILEIFIDEDQSGGNHIFDGTSSDGENAFSYHLVIYQPEDGGTVNSMVACDLAGTSWSSYSIPDYADHFQDFMVRRDGHKLTWEFSLKVHDDSYDDYTPENSRVTLEPGKKLGLSMAYCDNDDPMEYPKTRDHFIGSDRGPDEALSEWNEHWQNADVYGTLILENAAFNREPQIITEIPDMNINEYNVPHTLSDNLNNVFTDPDGDTLQYTASTEDSHLLVEILDDTALLVTADGHFAGASTITVQAFDGQYTVSMDIVVSSIVGNSNISLLENTLQIYPNPASSKLRIHLDNNMSGKFELDILDLNGRMLSRHFLFKTDRVLEYSIDISDFSPGVYLVRIKHKQSEIYRKIIH